MDEGDAGAPTPNPRLTVDEPCALGFEVLEGSLDGNDCIGDVMETLTLVGQESTHGGFIPQRGQQLNERSPHREHCLLDTLGLDDLAIQRLHAIPLSIAVQRGVEVSNGDGDVIEVEELHDHERIDRPVSCHAGGSTIGV